MNLKRNTDRYNESIKKTMEYIKNNILKKIKQNKHSDKFNEYMKKVLKEILEIRVKRNKNNFIKFDKYINDLINYITLEIEKTYLEDFEYKDIQSNMIDIL